MSFYHEAMISHSVSIMTKKRTVAIDCGALWASFASLEDFIRFLARQRVGGFVYLHVSVAICVHPWELYIPTDCTDLHRYAAF